MTKKIYYLEYYGKSGNGYVSFDNDSCNSLDMAMTFNSLESAIVACEKLQKEWKPELRIYWCSED